MQAHHNEKMKELVYPPPNIVDDDMSGRGELRREGYKNRRILTK